MIGARLAAILADGSVLVVGVYPSRAAARDARHLLSQLVAAAAGEAPAGWIVSSEDCPSDVLTPYDAGEAGVPE